LWEDIQLFKGKVNNYKTKIVINGNEVAVTYRSAPCNGVKACSEDGYSYAASIGSKSPVRGTQANHFTRPKI